MKNLKNLYTRLTVAGGQEQQDRMIEDKRKTLECAVKYSYQGAKIALLNATDSEIIPALINPNKLLVDYDEKTISVDYQYKISTGQIIRWLSSVESVEDTYWLIYLQDLTELAYFKADMRRCSHQISWMQEGIKHVSYATIKGPQEKTIKTIAKSQFNIDIPNYTLELLLPKTKEVLEYFQRYAKFYLSDIDNNNNNVCWQVEAIDSISLPGIIEVYAREYYANTSEGLTQKNTTDFELNEINASGVNIQQENMEIVGDNCIKPGFVYQYEYKGPDVAQWKWDQTLPIEINCDGSKINIRWTASYSGTFILQCNNAQKNIKVTSLF